jgi:hypothetical protein
MNIHDHIKVGSLIRSLVNNAVYGVTDSTIYEVIDHSYSLFKIINDNGKTLKISKGSEADEHWFELVEEKKEIDFLKLVKGY